MGCGYTFLANPVTVITNSTHTTYGDCVMVMSSFRRTRAIQNFKLCLISLMLCMSVVFVFPCMAQVSPTPANPQNPFPQSLQAGVDTSLLAVAPTVGTTPSVSAVQGVASISSSTRPGSLRSASGTPSQRARLPDSSIRKPTFVV